MHAWRMFSETAGDRTNMWIRTRNFKLVLYVHTPMNTFRLSNFVAQSLPTKWTKGQRRHFLGSLCTVARMPVTAGRNNSGLWTRRIRPSAYVKRYDDTVPRPIYISVHASRSDPTVSIDDWSTENSQIQARSHARTHAYTHGFEPHLGVFVCARARVCRGFHGLQIIRLTWIRLDPDKYYMAWMDSWTDDLVIRFTFPEDGKQASQITML